MTTRNGSLAIEETFETIDMMLNMGPQHPATHGVFRMMLTVDGEQVVDVTPHIGYLHRGSEKLAENETYGQVITLFDRLDYVANLNNELIYCRAVEKLMVVEVPERAQYIRVILAELNRLASHLLFIGTYAIDLGAMTPIMYGFRERERIENLFESVTGARMMHNFIRIGGIKEDVPPDFLSRTYEALNEIEHGVVEIDKLLTFNEVFLARTRGVGKIDAGTAISCGITGPSLRASGVPYDVRKDDTYEIYRYLNYRVPVGENGDCWDRYYMRVLECKESISMIRQCLEQIQEGPVVAQMRRIVRPPKGEVYVHGENPRGDIGVFLVSDGSDKPYRVKVRPPSFCNLVGLRPMMKEAYIADAVSILGSLDIVLGEVDR
ncbi:MAG: NADH-quinone oxidoreductase subunit NuoD [Chloroflexi bacterium]|nr:NADH-quinone oxidoreductase subunit NuoD [Chloroflexota bacterium]|tara:strand:- start:7206 stop:8339 length:1134 start_codon:yes stop_codon:yes gene_type:complete